MFMGVLRRVSHAKRTGHRLSRQYVQVKVIVLCDCATVCVCARAHAHVCAPFVVFPSFRACMCFLSNIKPFFFFFFFLKSTKGFKSFLI